MTEKGQSPLPLARANDQDGSGRESLTANKERRKRKRMKCIAYVTAFAVFLAAVILVLLLTVMRFRSPKFRMLAGTIKSNKDVTVSSFSLPLDSQFTIENSNFGPFKVEHGTVSFAYKGMTVGEATIGKARARARSTEMVNATVTLSSQGLAGNSGLESDLAGALLPLISSSKLDGKVHLFKVIEKKKSARMDCSFEINLGLRIIQNLKCN